MAKNRSLALGKKGTARQVDLLCEYGETGKKFPRKNLRVSEGAWIGETHVCALHREKV